MSFGGERVRIIYSFNLLKRELESFLFLSLSSFLFFFLFPFNSINMNQSFERQRKGFQLTTWFFSTIFVLLLSLFYSNISSSSIELFSSFSRSLSSDSEVLNSILTFLLPQSNCFLLSLGHCLLIQKFWMVVVNVRFLTPGNQLLTREPGKRGRWKDRKEKERKRKKKKEKRPFPWRSRKTEKWFFFLSLFLSATFFFLSTFFLSFFHLLFSSFLPPFFLASSSFLVYVSFSTWKMHE